MRSGRLVSKSEMKSVMGVSWKQEGLGGRREVRRTAIVDGVHSAVHFGTNLASFDTGKYTVIFQRSHYV